MGRIEVEAMKQFMVGDGAFVHNDKLQNEGFWPSDFHFTYSWNSFHLLHQPFSLHYGYDSLRYVIGHSLEEVK